MERHQGGVDGISSVILNEHQLFLLSWLIYLTYIAKPPKATGFFEILKQLLTQCITLNLLSKLYKA